MTSTDDGGRLLGQDDVEAGDAARKQALDEVLGRLGVPRSDLWDRAKAAVEEFLTERGYRPEEAWVGSIRWGRVDVVCVDTTRRYLQVDFDALCDKVRGVSDDLEVRLVRAPKRRIRRIPNSAEN